MSYQVLARKWRPNAFSDVVGQEHVLTILSNALALGRIHHAYLFSGTRGVGKTSIARLLAKCLNCETGITATPCGKCDNCRDIEQGRFVDLLEIDAASRTKVEDTREILDNIQYLPTKGRFKIYLIDEVHMLSRSSFNALLKTLEEPPEHVKFLLATTDPQKLPVTILSRCLHLHLKVLDTALISDQLKHILQSEDIMSEPRAIQLLAKAANGSMRDALSLTDQAIALGNGQVNTDSVATMLGTLDRSIPFALVEALFRGEGSVLMEQLEIAAIQGADWDTLLSETILLLHQIALLQLVPTAIGDYSDHEEQIRFLAKTISPNDIQLFYQILLMGRKELAFVPDKKMGIEMSFLRALAFMPKSFLSTAPVAVNDANQNSEKQVVHTPIASAPTSVKKEDKVASATLSAKSVKNGSVETVASSLNTRTTALPKEAPLSTKSILAMREQLIKEEQKRKKSEMEVKATPPAEVKPTIAAKTDQDDDETVVEMTAENYQWQPKNSIEIKDDLVIDTKAFIASLEGDKTAEMTQKLVDEMASKDSWCAEIEQLMVPPLVKQIAINSFLEQVDENTLVLHMRSKVNYLINSSDNVKKLEQAFAKLRGHSIKLSVILDDNQSIKTPLEQREVLYQEKLLAAKKEIHQDEKVAMICQFFDAQIDEESIRPV